MKRNISLLLLALLTVLSVNAQTKDKDSGLKVDASIDVYSLHLWRGFKSGDAPSVEPVLGFTFNEKWNFSIWGAYSLDEKYQEVDMWVSYTPNNNFSFTLFDYYDPNTMPFDEKAFDFGKKTSEHLFEGVVDYTNNKIPLRFKAGLIFYGNDRDEKGDNYYSLYLEAGYTQKIIENLAIDFYIGGAPYKGLYSDKAAIVNVGSTLLSSLTIGKKYIIPITAQYVWNPYASNTFFRVGASFTLF
ncbi:MAG: hypothetical protein ACEPOV_10010 [Hyphomicrobiales bacterium]